MWAWYGQKYTGCAIGFDAKCFYRKGIPSIHQVRYVSGNCSIELNDPAELADWRLTTKFSDWAWQREWRDIVSCDDVFLDQDSNNYLMKFPSNAIREIILGIRILHDGGGQQTACNELLALGVSPDKIRFLTKNIFTMGSLDNDTLI